MKKDNINVNGFEISLYTRDFKTDYISLTDIAKFKNKDNPADVVKNWLRNRNTVEFLGVWEQIHNPNFKLVEFDQFRKENKNQKERFLLLQKEFQNQIKLFDEKRTEKIGENL